MPADAGKEPGTKPFANQIPEITKNVDAFYIYATEYIMSSFEEGAPDFAPRMVAAYAIGYSVTDGYLAATPYLKFAAGESDTGVIIAWNTEGPKNVETNAYNILLQPNTRSISPLNWKLDETYAPASMKLGSLVEDGNEPSLRHNRIKPAASAT